MALSVAAVMVCHTHLPSRKFAIQLQGRQLTSSFELQCLLSLWHIWAKARFSPGSPQPILYKLGLPGSSQVCPTQHSSDLCPRAACWVGRDLFRWSSQSEALPAQSCFPHIPPYFSWPLPPNPPPIPLTPSQELNCLEELSWQQRAVSAFLFPVRKSPWESNNICAKRIQDQSKATLTNPFSLWRHS